MTMLSRSKSNHSSQTLIPVKCALNHRRWSCFARWSCSQERRYRVAHPAWQSLHGIAGCLRLTGSPKQGEGWVFLDWKEPIDGGQVAAYKVQRRERPAGECSDVATAMESEITLNGQTRSKEFEFCVIAMNKASEGESSNSGMVVL